MCSRKWAYVVGTIGLVGMLITPMLSAIMMLMWACEDNNFMTGMSLISASISAYLGYTANTIAVQRLDDLFFEELNKHLGNE